MLSEEFLNSMRAELAKTTYVTNPKGRSKEASVAHYNSYIAHKTAAEQQTDSSKKEYHQILADHHGKMQFEVTIQ